MVIFSCIPKYKQTAEILYKEITFFSRTPYFYSALGVPDTLDGRYEMQCLLVALVILRLNSLEKKGRKQAQKLFDWFFRSSEGALREIGIGDLSVPKHMRRMMKGFNGRLIVLSDILAPGEKMDISKRAFREESPMAEKFSGKASQEQSEVKELEGYLYRNLYATAGDVKEGEVKEMAANIIRIWADLESYSFDDICRGSLFRESSATKMMSA